ncbi:MAG TPA: TIGR03936 family radical SAM-associated protein [Dehalococcoidales bacterium]|nr:TIGR03936 family radical SAM-associated protein [Dehalococcoidales bacterium]
MQRLRIRFSREEEIKFISHLDIMRLWQRALHRAEIPLAYTEGFSPHPRISLAAPLAVGVTSQAELMDVFCSKWVSPHFFTNAVSQQLPAGIEIRQVYSIAPTMPSLQSQVSQAEYEVELETEKDQAGIKAALTSLLSAEQFPWHHERDTGTRNYDLRALIDDLWLVNWRQGYSQLGMRLRCDSGGSGRPEQVAAALGFSHPTSISRSKLLLKTG